MAIIKKKKPTNNNCWWGCGEKGTLEHCWWECKLVQPLLENSMEVPQKPKNRITVLPSNSIPRYISKRNKNTKTKKKERNKETKTLIWKDTWTPMLIAALFAISKTWKQPKCPSMNEWIWRCDLCIQLIIFNSNYLILNRWIIKLLIQQTKNYCNPGLDSQGSTDRRQTARNTGDCRVHVWKLTLDQDVCPCVLADPSTPTS